MTSTSSEPTAAHQSPRSPTRSAGTLVVVVGVIAVVLAAIALADGPTRARPVKLPPGLTVAIVPKLGQSPTTYFEHVNGSPPRGRRAYISDDLGLPAIRMDLSVHDPPSAGDYSRGVRRNQLIDPKRVDGTAYTLSEGETVYNGVRIKYGPRTHVDSSSFVSNFNWVSFINGRDSGPFALGQDGHFSGRAGLRFSTAFGIRNSHYGTPGHHDYANLPFPHKWMDVLVAVRYSKSWREGWLELSWKWASEPTSSFKKVRFPAPGNPTRYVSHTLGDTLNTVATGIYTRKAMNMQWGLAAFFVAPLKQSVLEAFDALGPAD
jgi:hypothetical protein